MDELDNINPVDMECNITDDDDLVITSTDSAESVDDRNVQSKTGIIITFDDDDEIPTRRITATTSLKDDRVDISNDFSDTEVHDYNEIDMETDYCEDDDEIIPRSKSKQKPIFEDTDDEEFGLTSPELLESRKKATSFGEVEDNYWEKISAKHRKSNKKGAYNAAFHFAGDPKAEQDVFNHMMGSTKAASVSSDSSLISSGDAAAGGGDNAGGSAGCCENLSTTTSASDKLQDLFDLIGFEVFKNSDSSYVAIDACDIIPSVNAKSLAKLVDLLKPYIDDFLVYPLQMQTGEDMTEYADWAKWYDAEMQKKFPNCASDIEYCDLLANHLDSCKID